MTAAWMLYGIVISTVLACAALAVERLCRMHHCATRGAWAGAVVGTLLIPLLVASLSDASGARAPRDAVTIRAAATDVTLAAMSGAPYLSIARNLTSEIAAFDTTDVDKWLSVTWRAISAVLLLIIAGGSWRLWRRSSGWTRSRLDGAAVFVAHDVGPAVFGFLRPRIIVPMWLLDADAATQRAVIGHEREHIAARDPQLLVFTLLIVALLPWNLPLWYCWRRLRFAVEVDCDARVVRAGQPATEYGEALLSVAARRTDLPALSIGTGMNGSMVSALEQRIRLLFAPEPGSRMSTSLALLLLAITLTASAAQVVPPEKLPEVAATRASDAPDAKDIALGDGLVLASMRGDFDTAAALIDAGADVNRVLLGDGTATIAAARRGDVRLVRHLLDKGALANLACPGDGNPLIMAAAYGNLDVAAVLLEHGANVNAVVIGDETPLINAARAGRLEMVRFLVERGADVNLKARADYLTTETRSPVSEAIKHHHRDVVDYLRARGAV